MGQPRHVLINGLSIGSGGGATVARGLFHGIARERPDWTVTMSLIKGFSLHEEFLRDALAPNQRLTWAPPETRGRLARLRYERSGLIDWMAQNKADALVMLNGQVIRGCPIPTLAHNQDPWPYRPEAWSGPKDRLMAWIKRREQGRALRQAAAMGFTSGYQRDLVCGYHGLRPRRADVYYNGLPQPMIDRARAGGAGNLAGRKRQIVSVSNVSAYKRQEMVIRALAALRKRPGMEQAKYRIIGHVEKDYREHLNNLARTLGVADAVSVEGRVAQEEMERAMAESACFTLMSVCESFGIPAIEAMSFGTPAVISDCCAHPEIGGGAAALVPEDDQVALEQTLARVMTDGAYAAELAARGLKRVEAFQWNETARQMAGTLEAIIEEGAKARR